MQLEDRGRPLALASYIGPNTVFTQQEGLADFQIIIIALDQEKCDEKQI